MEGRQGRYLRKVCHEESQRGCLRREDTLLLQDNRGSSIAAQIQGHRIHSTEYALGVREHFTSFERMDEKSWQPVE